jgi:hypothetical protein
MEEEDVPLSDGEPGPQRKPRDNDDNDADIGSTSSGSSQGKSIRRTTQNDLDSEGGSKSKTLLESCFDFLLETPSLAISDQEKIPEMEAGQ